MIHVKPIHLVRMRNGRDSLACCAAMIVGCEYHEIEATSICLRLELDGLEHGDFRRILAFHQVASTVCYAPDPGLVCGLYALEVADLNIPGELMWIVADARDAGFEVGEPVLLDPNRGLRDRKYYGLQPTVPEVQLRGNHQLHSLTAYGRGIYCERPYYD